MDFSVAKYKALLDSLDEDLLRGFESKHNINLSKFVGELPGIEQLFRRAKRMYAIAFAICCLFLAMIFFSDMWETPSLGSKVCGFLFVLLVIFLTRAFFLDTEPIKESYEASQKFLSRVQELVRMLNPFSVEHVHFNRSWLLSTFVVIASDILKVETKITKSVSMTSGMLNDAFELEVERLRLYVKYAHISLAAKEFGVSFDVDEVFEKASHIYQVDLWVIVWTKEQARRAVSDFAATFPCLAK